MDGTIWYYDELSQIGEKQNENFLCMEYEAHIEGATTHQI